ncbi:MAG: ABC-2 type transport system ATP-binding protein [Pseudohongiellaceae bacterium]
MSLNQVSRSFGETKAVKSLSLDVPEGTIYGFIGPNGSGKTTSIRMILNIIHPDSGTIEVLGHQGKRAANDRVGYLPEERGLYKKLKVNQILAYYASLKGMSFKEAKRVGAEWLERFDLGHTANQKIETLSKGMAQKVQFIATVLTRPDLLILDEPFSGLDPVNHESLRDAILDLNRGGTTVIFSTHDMSMAERMCDHICMIYKGDKVLDGTLNEIQNSKGDDTVRLRFDGDASLLDGHPSVDRVTDMGQYQEVRLAGDAQALLQHLVAQTSVQLFEIARPSLHDIFVRIAGPEAAQAVAATAHSAPSKN